MAFLCGYEIIEEVATGGFSTVYRVKECEPPYREFAAKRFKNITDHAIFEQEIHSLHSVHGVANTQQFFRAICHKDQLVILTEYVEGESLKSHIDREGPLSEQRAIETTLAIAKILEDLHTEGLLHLDIKPSNILISDENILTVTDFGIAEPLTRSRNEVAKTDFSYTAPEKYFGYQHAASDVYSLGVSLHYFLTGSLPFGIHATSDAFKMLSHCIQAVTPPTHVSEQVQALLRQMMEKSPKKRISMPQLIQSLHAIKSDTLSTQRPEKQKTKKSKKPSEKECFAEAARRNIPFGQYRYALLCEDDEADNALYWYTQAAEAGFARAQNNLALLYADQGNEEMAVKWYRAAAESGNAFSQYNLARTYDSRNASKEARHWYTRAAKSGHERAQNILAIELENSRDIKGAFKLYQKAAYSGFRAAQFNLGLMYEKSSTPSDKSEQLDLACFWYKQAAEQNHSKAKQRLSRIESSK